MSTRLDTLRRVYATLSSLQKNIPVQAKVHEKYVSEYHRVIASLEMKGFNLDEFKIPESEIRKTVISFSGHTGETNYSKDQYVERSFLLTKLDALLGYFELEIADSKPSIGFGSPVLGTEGAD